jgi:single stranded DNA-binding protein
MNQVTLLGYVGQVPTVRTFEDTGNKLVKFSLAVKEYNPKSDTEKTLWFDVAAWNGLADRVEQYVTNKRQVLVTGRLSLETFDKEINGVTVEVTRPVIKLSAFDLCGKKPEPSESTVAEDKPKAFKLSKPRKKA